MELIRDTILVLACLGMFSFVPGAFAQTNTPSTDSFLPKGAVTEAVYVQIERDPALDDYGRRIREAREKNPEWFYEYAKKHERPPSVPLPYHENFGVSKEEYERFSQPMNHFREVSRKSIKMRRGTRNGTLQFDFEGADLLLTKIVLNLDDTVSTHLDTLPKMPFVETDRASLPPGRHRGAHFRTPDAKIATSKRRESVVIGELTDTNSAIIHYHINIPGQIKMSYIQFPK
jgi:hypothetical protein